LVLLHRGADNAIRLSLFDRNLAPVAAFGTAGVVTLAPAARAEDTRRPAMCVRGSEVAVVWPEGGSDRMLFQRFRLANGTALDAAPVPIGLGTQTSAHPYLVHNGSRFAAAWCRESGGQHRVLVRFIANDGTPAGSDPVEIGQQPQRLRDVHLTWNPRARRYRLVWISEDVHAGGDVISQRINADGSADSTQGARRIVTLGATSTARRPFIGLHPASGYAVCWEDSTLTARFDVFAALLSEDGAPDGRIAGNRLRISDTPNDTQGFTSVVASGAVSVIWQSNDEINSDVRAVYALNLTLQGALQAQADPSVPLLASGRYVPHRLADSPDSVLGGVALAWGGGPFFHARTTLQGASMNLVLVRTNADGLPDAAFGPNGARTVAGAIALDGTCLRWDGAQLMAAATFDFDSTVALFRPDGTAEAGFGTNGRRSLGERTATQIYPQLDSRGTGNAFRLFVAYGRQAGANSELRCLVLNRSGAAVIGARTLHVAAGTARQGWFHFVPTETPARAIAVWHQRDAAGRLSIHMNRYNLLAGTAAGMPQHAAAVALTAIAGDSQNAVVAPRPVLFQLPTPANAAQIAQSRQREYGLAWENLPAPGGRSQIRFSQLRRDGTPGAVRDVLVVSHVTDHATEPQLVWHTDGYGLAWLQRTAAGGPKRLMFGTLNPLGAFLPVAAHQLSAGSADVQSYHLVWNGRAFRAAWTEREGGRIRHMQRAIAVPRTPPPVRGFDEPYQHPSSALVRATLINGATNIRGTALPNVPSTAPATHNPNDGYGWGRLNLRQSLAPAPPVTFQVRDDGSVAAGRTVRYEFSLPPGTRLLRITLVWTDPPGNAVVNHLSLRVRTPAGGAAAAQTFVGNRWRPAPNARFSAPLPTPPPANPFDLAHTTEQVVIPGTPTLPTGVYAVEVIAGAFGTSAFQQFPGQPFALVIVGSGNEWPLVHPGGGPLPFF
jgi:hypothetical protein